VEDKSAGVAVGVGFAVATADIAPISPPVAAGDNYIASQKLCSSSQSSATVPATTMLPAPTLSSPICCGDTVVTIGNTIVNATVVVVIEGAGVVAAGGAVGGNLKLPLGGAKSFQCTSPASTVVAYQYMGNTTSDPSNKVPVTYCKKKAKFTVAYRINLGSFGRILTGTVVSVTFTCVDACGAQEESTATAPNPFIMPAANNFDIVSSIECAPGTASITATATCQILNYLPTIKCSIQVQTPPQATEAVTFQASTGTCSQA
jgi:hypothetical protein